MKFILIIALAITFSSCKRETVHTPLSYTVVIVNGALGVIAQSNFTNSGNVAYGSRGIFYAQSGQQLTVATANAPNTFIYNQVNLFQRGVYSLFVIGDSANSQTLFKDEIDYPFIPNDKIYNSADSVVNIRFINLSANSVPLKIRLSTASTNEVENLSYKEISTWRPFKATATTTNYIVQIRNAANDALITSYTFTANATNRFKNVTLMIRGLQGTTTGSNAFGVTPINYF